VTRVAAAIEVGTGFFLMVAPAALVWLLLGADLSQPGLAVGRIAGIALLTLGLACWPRPEAASRRTRVPFALLVYNVLITLYLAYLGIGTSSVGILLWPAVAVHAALSIALIHVQFFGSAT
jgi:hypothetical protein